MASLFHASAYRARDVARTLIYHSMTYIGFPSACLSNCQTASRVSFLLALFALEPVGRRPNRCYSRHCTVRQCCRWTSAQRRSCTHLACFRAQKLVVNVICRLLPVTDCTILFRCPVRSSSRSQFNFITAVWSCAHRFLFDFL